VPQEVIRGDDERFCGSPGRLHPVTSDDLAVTALPILLYGGRLRPPRRLTFARAELPSMNQRNDQHERFAVPLRKTVRVFCAGHRMLLPMQNRLLSVMTAVAAARRRIRSSAIGPRPDSHFHRRRASGMIILRACAACIVATGLLLGRGVQGTEPRDIAFQADCDGSMQSYVE